MQPSSQISSLKPWFQTLADIGPQLVWRDFFGNDQPVELDIGCGRGLFLYNAAISTPSVNFAGIEIDYREGRRTATRLKKQALGNARVIGGDACRVLAEMASPASIHAVHVYFPDPWWKKRHQKRRIFNPEFVALLSRVLESGGYVHHWTDVADYFELVCSLMDDHPDYAKLPPPSEREAGHDMDYHTSFERKKRKLGLPIFRALWQRK